MVQPTLISIVTFTTNCGWFSNSQSNITPRCTCRRNLYIDGNNDQVFMEASWIWKEPAAFQKIIAWKIDFQHQSTRSRLYRNLFTYAKLKWIYMKLNWEWFLVKRNHCSVTNLGLKYSRKPQSNKSTKEFQMSILHRILIKPILLF